MLPIRGPFNRIAVADQEHILDAPAYLHRRRSLQNLRMPVQHEGQGQDDQYQDQQVWDGREGLGTFHGSKETTAHQKIQNQ